MQRKCNEITNDIDLVNFYQTWKTWWNNKNDPDTLGLAKNLEDLFCRDESATFRDCRNIETIIKPLELQLRNEKLKEKINYYIFLNFNTL